MNHQYNNSKLVAAINGLTNSSTHSNLIPHQQQQQLHHHNQIMQQPQPTQQQQTTTDAIIVQSNSSVVSDEFIMQLQEQFGGDNKQIYILNNNQVLNQSNSGQSNSNGDNSQANQIQYLIVDKDVDINVILQDPSIFNQTNMNSGQQQQLQQQPQQQQLLYSANAGLQLSSSDLSTVQMQQQPIQPIQQQQQTNPKPAYLPKQQFINQNNTTSRYGVTNTVNQIQSVNKNTVQSGANSSSSLIQNNNLINNQPNLIEESIQRVQVPPPKRKQFEFKLENKRNSYQDVFLRFLAGEKQPTLEIVSEHASKKPKDNLYLYQTTSNVSNSANKFASNQIQSKITISNSPSQSTNLSNTNITQATNASSPTVTLDKENYYNSSRRENLLPLNNYEYRNSYKDHYDNQGVRVNPAVLKNLSYSSSGAATAEPLPTGTPVGRATTPQPGNRMMNQSGKVMSTNGTSQIHVNGNNADNGPRGNTKSPIVMNKSNQVPINTSSSSVANSNELNQLFGYANSIIDNNTDGANSSMEANSSCKNNKTQLGIVTGLEEVISSGVSSHAPQVEHDQNIPKSDSILPQIINKVLDPVQGTESAVSNCVQMVGSTNNNSAVATSKMGVSNELVDAEEEVTFGSGEFLIHKSTFSGDFDNYDIWCVLDDGYLQKYEPVLLASGERCHQSADVVSAVFKLAQYTPDKTEFLLVKVDEKGKTEQNNIVVGVLPEYEPKNRKFFINQQILPNIYNHSNADTANSDDQKISTDMNGASTTAAASIQPGQALNTSSSSNSNVVVVTYDDLKATLDVFLQVLLSQHLNSEFLVRIKELQDEYFKPSIEFIDTILNEKYALLINNFSHFMNLKKTDSTKTPTEYIFNPLFKYLFEAKPKLISHQAATHNPTKCQAIDTLDEISTDVSLIATYLVKFDGSTYNSDTLIPITDFSELNSLINEQMEKEGSQKEFLVCAKTLQFVQLCHSVKHLKMNFYEICQQKIEQVKLQINESVNQVASDILNFCLADTDWLLEMFEKFKQLLFDVDSLLSDDQQSSSHMDSSNVIMNPLVMTGDDNQHVQQMSHDTTGDIGNSSRLNEHSSGIGSVETNKLINDQISQIITNVEEINNEMETS